MKLIKKVLKAIFFPHGAVFVLLIPLSAGMLVYAFAVNDVHAVQQYAAYFISAYSLTAFCCKTPEFIAGIRRIRNENKFALRYRKYNSPLYSAAKATSFAAAMVSMLTLETAMLTAFGEPGRDGFNRFMTGATGTVVLVSILAMAVYMTVKSSKALNALEKGETIINEQ